ncbi:hypothetical protein FHS57_000101 [Runella defluvii]|uniref:Uncharacterized protein n=1 Tax=Runella defluvii TaxID=370973 RepID=A0A7W5ZHV6_9BACT|nr:hypothetical protein [Runella defluvii]MBB3836119.1 hypothetical protein [Runella defluvii]
MDKTKSLHRISGIIIAIFAAAHLFNHAMAWYGIETHREIMEALRNIYRQPVVETVLLLCFGFQVYSGMKQAVALRKMPHLSLNDRLQMYAGLAFAFFIVQHIGAVVGQRLYFGTNTDFYFAARVVLEAPFKYYFVPYYFLGIMALGVHVAATHRKKIAGMVGEKQATFHGLVITALAFFTAILILYVFMGGRYEIAIPKV